MPLLPATLGAGLANMAAVDNEPEAIDNFVNAWESYFTGATVAVIPVTPGSLSGALTAMRGSMIGLSLPNNAAVAIQSGIVAFWGVVAVAAVSIWLTFPVPPTAATPPPSNVGIAAAVSAAFASNFASEVSLSAAANNIATAIHSTQLGGIALIPPPVVGIGPQPIL